MYSLRGDNLFCQHFLFSSPTVCLDVASCTDSRYVMSSTSERKFMAWARASSVCVSPISYVVSVCSYVISFRGGNQQNRWPSLLTMLTVRPLFRLKGTSQFNPVKKRVRSVRTRWKNNAAKAVIGAIAWALRRLKSKKSKDERPRLRASQRKRRNIFFHTLTPHEAVCRCTHRDVSVNSNYM